MSAHPCNRATAGVVEAVLVLVVPLMMWSRAGLSAQEASAGSVLPVQLLSELVNERTAPFYPAAEVQAFRSGSGLWLTGFVKTFSPCDAIAAEGRVADGRAVLTLRATAGRNGCKRQVPGWFGYRMCVAQLPPSVTDVEVVLDLGSGEPMVANSVLRNTRRTLMQRKVESLRSLPFTPLGKCGTGNGGATRVSERRER